MRFAFSAAVSGFPLSIRFCPSQGDSFGSVQNLSHFQSCDGGSVMLKFHLAQRLYVHILSRAPLRAGDVFQPSRSQAEIGLTIGKGPDDREVLREQLEAATSGLEAVGTERTATPEAGSDMGRSAGRDSDVTKPPEKHRALETEHEKIPTPKRIDHDLDL